jgi:hypothetical protein
MMDMKNFNKKNGTMIHSSRVSSNKHLSEGQLLRVAAAIFTLLVSVALTACSAAASTTNPAGNQPPASVPQATTASTPVGIPTAVNTPENTSTPTQAPAATATSLPPAAATQLDPCVLINSETASALAGVTFGDGVDSTTPEGLKTCTYGSQTTNILIVDVVQAADVATAQAAKQQFLTDLQTNLAQLTSAGMNITQLPDFADGAVMANIDYNVGGISISGNAIGFLKGTVFFGFSDLALGGTAPTDKAMQDEATAVLGMLP